MSDPLGLIGSSQASNLQRAHQAALRADKAAGGAGGADGPDAASFNALLMQNLREVNTLQQDATRAIEDLQTGKRDDLETVMMATQKADTAFRMLMQVRNKVLDAYNEIRQIRV